MGIESFWRSLVGGAGGGVSGGRREVPGDPGYGFDRERGTRPPMMEAAHYSDPVRGSMDGFRDPVELGWALGPNLLNQLNRIGGASVPAFDPDVGYADVFRNAGYSDAAAMGLGIAADVAEPGPPVRAIGAMAALSPRLLQRLADALPTPRGARAAFQPLPRQHADLYVEAVNAMPEGMKGFLTRYTPDQLRVKMDEGTRVFMHPSGSGYMIDPAGDLQGVFNSGGVRGLGAQAVEHAKRQGVISLDAFDVSADIAGVNLPEYYGRFGFREVDRLRWNDAYAPPGWDYERYGRPDVVIMRLMEEAAP